MSVGKQYYKKHNNYYPIRFCNTNISDQSRWATHFVLLANTSHRDLLFFTRRDGVEGRVSHLRLIMNTL